MYCFTGCKIPSRNGVNVSTTPLILATWTTTSNYFLPICVQCAENGERKSFFESNTVLNLWKCTIFHEVSPTKVSSLSFNTTYEDLCVKNCVSQGNGIEKSHASRYFASHHNSTSSKSIVRIVSKRKLSEISVKLHHLILS